MEPVHPYGPKYELVVTWKWVSDNTEHHWSIPLELEPESQVNAATCAITLEATSAMGIPLTTQCTDDEENKSYTCELTAADLDYKYWIFGS